MKFSTAFIAIVASLIFSTSAHAQSKFQGNYKIYIGYTEGGEAGNAGYGTVTIDKSGKLAATIYWPLSGDRGKASGKIDNKGSIVLNGGGKAKAILYDNKVAVGDFSDQGGKGFYILKK